MNNFEPTRKAAVAGKFYPGEREKLLNAVNFYLDDAVAPLGQKPLAIVVPHAGYIYSGQIAADAFRQAKGYDYDLVIVLGTNHTTSGFRKISIYPSGKFETPLGALEIDSAVAKKLIDADEDFTTDTKPHISEHSVEVQLPFIQVLFPKAKIVPVVIGEPDINRCEKFGKAIAAAVKDRNALIVASSDLSHYPSYDNANRADNKTLNAIAEMDAAKLQEEIEKSTNDDVTLSTCACGEGPIITAIAVVKALNGKGAKVLSYANSGDTFIGNKSKVVGYGAVAFYKDKPEAQVKAEDKNEGNENDIKLQTADKKYLLNLARKTLNQYFLSETLPLARNINKRLLTARGAFVTLKIRGELRGCIGHMAEDMPLAETVGKMALQAAFNDTRFNQLEYSELAKVDIEISALTPFTKIGSADEIVMGQDGVIVNKNGRQAVFLPQVATETGWTKEEFLDRLCYKAGLSKGDWKSATLYTFQADVFGETDYR